MAEIQRGSTDEWHLVVTGKLMRVSSEEEVSKHPPTNKKRPQILSEAAAEISRLFEQQSQQIRLQFTVMKDAPVKPHQSHFN